MDAKLSASREALRRTESEHGPEAAETAAAWRSLGLVQAELRLLEEAEASFRRALSIWEGAGPAHDSDRGAALNDLAEALVELQRRAEAGPAFRRSLELLEQALGPDHPDVANVLKNFAVFTCTEGHFAEFRRIADRALEIMEVFEDAGEDDYPREVLSTLRRLHYACLTVQVRAVLYNADYPAAIAGGQRCVDAAIRTFGPEHEEVGRAINNLALIHSYARDFPLARRLIFEARDHLEKVHGAGHPAIAYVYANLATILSSTREYEEAERFSRIAVELERRKQPTDRHKLARLLLLGATISKDLGRLEEGQATVEESLALLATIVRPDHPDVAVAELILAELAMARGHAEDVERRCRRAEELMGDQFIEFHSRRIDLHRLLAWSLRRRGRDEEAAEQERLLTGISERLFGALGKPPATKEERA